MYAFICMHAYLHAHADLCMHTYTHVCKYMHVFNVNFTIFSNIVEYFTTFFDILIHA